MDERQVSEVNVVIVKDLKGLLMLKEEWKDIEKSSEIYPFNTFEWVTNWWEFFGINKKLWILNFYKGDFLIGIAPFMITYGEMGLLAKRIKFIGSNNSDYLDFIVREGYESIFYKSLFNFLENKMDIFTVLDLEHIPESSKLFSFLTDNKLDYKYDVQDICPYVMLPESWDIYINSLNGKFRRNLNYETKRFFKDYDGTFSNVTDIKNLNYSMDKLIELHQARWKKKHMPGVFYSNKVRKFHKKVAKDMLLNRRLSLFELKDKDKVVSSLLSYHVNKKRYYYISGYDLDYDKRSVGTIMVGLAIKKSIEEGDEIFDFLRGDEDYKKNWTLSKKRNIRFIAANSNTLGRFYINYILSENKIIKKIKSKFN
ncbi:MAG: GNAT family N-acetyltransferase [Thermoanaerobacteraceae bacterium]